PAAECAVKASPGDFVFALPPYTESVAEVIPVLVERGAVALALLESPAPDVILAAEQCGLTLLTLPPSDDVRRLERAVLGLLVDRNAAMERRAGQVYAQLTVLSAEDAGLEEMAALIGRTTGKTVLIQDKRLTIMASALAPELGPRREQVEAWLTAAGNLPEELRDRKLAAQGPSIVEQPLALDGLTRVIVPIISKGMARGFLSLIGESSSLGSFDRTVAERS
ncbi:MAG: hypothetical protein M1482_05535, partial [Chloroflexi bacterium]|nr:hypothetical protein [Chloroflexota bacterium]